MDEKNLGKRTMVRAQAGDNDGKWQWGWNWQWI